MRLELGRNNLNGSLSEAWDLEESGLKTLAALQHLDLGEQRLVGTLPEGLGHLTALESLSLRANQLSGSIPFELYTLADGHRLTDIDLSANDFDYEASEALLDNLLPVCQATGREMNCDGLPPFVCDAFGPQGEDETAYYMVSISNSNGCVRCDGWLVPLVTLSLLAVLFVIMLCSYVTFMWRHPERMKTVVTTFSILISHVQTLSIITNLRLAWPESVETVTWLGLALGLGLG